MQCKSIEEYLLAGADIGACLKPHMNQFMVDYYYGWIEELYMRKGYEDWKMDWHQYNLRAGARKVVPGVLAEFISSIVASTMSNISSNLILCQDKEKQLSGIDIIDLNTGITIQTKTYITHSGFDRIYKSKEIIHPVTDYIALVDIDDNRCYIIESTKLQQYVASRRLYKQPGPLNSTMGWACLTHEMEQMAENSCIITNHLYERKDYYYSKEQCNQLKKILN